MMQRFLSTNMVEDEFQSGQDQEFSGGGVANGNGSCCANGGGGGATGHGQRLGANGA